MKCKKCRAEIEKGSKFCPKCGAKIKHTGRRIAAVILILAIIAGGVGVAGWKFGLFPFINTNEAASSEGFALLTDSFTDRKITDQASALAAVGDVADILGIEDVNAEFSECKMDTVSGNTYYRFYQEYEGIPVYGRSVVVVADEDGEGLSLSGNYVPIFELDIDAVASQEAVNSVIQEYFCEQLGASETDDLFIEEISTDAMCVYNMDNHSCLAYQLFVVSQLTGCYEVVVNAQKPEILYVNTLIQHDYEYKEAGQMETVSVNGQRTMQTFDVYSQDGVYYMADVNRHIELYQLENSTSDYWSWANLCFESKTVYTGNKFEVFWDNTDQATEYVSEIDALSNIQVAYDYYAKELAHKSTDGQGKTKIYLCTNAAIIDEESKKDWTDNAASGSDIENYVTVIYVGQAKNNQYTCSADLDIMAHEYTHAVIKFACNLRGQDETSAINEGISDIFGELVEEWENGSCDWVHGNRTIYNPSVNGYAETVSDRSNGTEDYAHGHSTVISHAAYLMYTGIGGNLAVESLSTNDLAHLFYRTLYTLPSDCTFSQFRTLVENTADMMCRQGALTEKQRLCVSKAFSQVGVTPSQTVCYTVSGDLALLVYDVNGEPYSDYDVSVSLLTATHAGIPFSFKETSQTYAANERLHLGDGKTDQFAQITITDKGGSQDSITYNVKIRSSGKSELRIYTDFGEAADDGFSAYLEAAAKTTATGSWTEDSIMTATWSAPVVSGITSKILTLQDLVTVTSCVDIDGYKKDDSSNLRFSGLADVTIAWQDYSYDNYGEYIDEGVESEELEVIGFFDPYSVTRDMVSSSVCLGNVIKFTVRGDAMTQAGIFTADPLWFCKTDGVEIDGDVYVTAEISMGKIDTLSMSFHMVMVNFNSSGLDAEADCVIEYRFFESETPSTDSADIIFDRIVEVNESNDALYEYATITSVDADGKTQWSYKTAEYECTELQRVEEIGLANGLYYFNASGTITALDPDDGRIVWENNDFGGVSIAFDWSDNGDLFLCGYYGPDFFWVDSSGTTKQRIETVDENYYWPSNIEYSGNQVAITMSGTPSGYGEHVLIVNLDALNGNPIVSSYQAVLQQHPKSTLHGYTSVETEYTLYDIDKDGILELIVKEDYAKYYIYTFDGISATQCGMFYWSYNDCLYEYDGNGMIVHNGGIGYLHIEYLALCVLTNGTLEENIMIESPDYDEIYSQIEAYTPINNFYPIDDDTYLLENS